MSIKASELTPVMRTVPADPALSIEAYLPNGDIGFVRTGQAVSVKLEAFPFTRTARFLASSPISQRMQFPNPMRS